MTAAIVVGARSMLGRELRRQLAAEGATVFCAGRAADDDVRLDLVAPVLPRVPDGVRATTLFHCAASFAGDDADGLRANLATNTTGAAAVLALAQQAGCAQLVVAGSILSCAGVDPAGLSSYGLSKALGEQALQWGAGRIGARLACLRLPQLYDTEGRCRAHQPWFCRIVAHAAAGVDLRLPPSQGVRNFVHVEDAARLLLAAARSGLEGTWPVLHPEDLDHSQLAALAYREFARGGVAHVDATKTPFRGFAFPERIALPAPLVDALRIGMAEGLARIHRAGAASNFGPADAA